MSVILITGSSRGIGYNLAELLAREGHAVIASSRSPNEALMKLAGRFDNVKLLTLDVSDEESVCQAAQRVKADFGELDAVVSNAGLNVERAKSANIFNLRDTDLREMLEVNVIGAARVIRFIGPLVKDGGLFITVTSEAGSIQNAFTSMPGYAISKAAENKLVTIQRATTSRYNVIAVHPGRVDTDMGHDTAQISPSESVSGIAALLTGRVSIPKDEWFVDYLGHPMAY